MNIFLKIFLSFIIFMVSIVLMGVSSKLTGTSLIGLAVGFGGIAAIRAVWRYGKVDPETLPNTEVEQQELDKS
jgi:hypothetical protein